MEKGYIHIYTGNGKGKTTAALGLALRAIGAGKSVYLAQFLKKGFFSGQKALNLLSGTLKHDQKILIEQFGTGRFIRGEADDREKERAAQGVKRILEIMGQGEFDLIIMDEAVTACSLALISDKEIETLLNTKKRNAELVLTGRGVTDFLKKKADLVTEMKEIKHYYKEGVEAREGIEF